MPVLPRLWYFSVSEEWHLAFFPYYSLLMMTWELFMFFNKLESKLKKKQNCAYATKGTIYVLGICALSFLKRAPLCLPCLTQVILHSLFLTTFKFMNSHVIFLT